MDEDDVKSRAGPNPHWIGGAPSPASSSGSDLRPIGSNPPPRIPDHELLRCIGGGSYGEVWLARNILGAWRAVKVIYRRSFERNRPFEREFEGMQKFEPISRSHESQLNILQVGRNEDEGYFYYVMELADDAGGESEKVGKRESEQDGVTVRPTLSPSHRPTFSPASYAPKTLKSELAKQGRLPLEQCLRIGLGLTTALEHLHKHRLAHRDVKPSNIIFVNGIPKLADIGLVTSLDATVSFVGTPGYLPPEGPGSPQADIYSLGKVLYEISVGRDRQNFPELPADWEGFADEQGLLELNEVVLKACHHDPRQRYQSAREMHADLALLNSGRSVKRLRTIERRLSIATKIGAGAGALALIALAGYVGSLRQAGRADKMAKAELHQRQIAERASRQAQEANTQLTEALTRLQIQKAEDLLADEETPTALAYLARLLRQQPTNQVVAQRIVSALSRRPLALPLTSSLHHTREVYHAGFSPDNRWLLTWDLDRKARLWENRTGQPAKLEQEFTSEMALFNRDGRRLLVLSSTEVRLVDTQTGLLIFPPIQTEGRIQQVCFATDRRHFVTLAPDGTTQTRDAQTGTPATSPILLVGLGEVAKVYSMHLNPEGTKVATIHTNQTARIWDARTGQPLTPVLPYEYRPYGMGSIVFSPDGEKAMVLVSPSSAQVFSIQTGKPLGEPLRHRAGIRSAQFSPDSQRIVTSSDDHTARVWDVATGQPLGEPLRHKSWVYDARFSPEGLRVVTASADRTARVWDAFTGQPLTEPLQHKGALRCASFSDDGQRVATGSEDGMARIWDALPGPNLPQTMRHDGYVVMARFSPDGKTVFSASADETARLWDARTGQLRWPPVRHQGEVRRAVFSPGGERLVTVAADGYIRFWDLHTGQLLQPPLKEDGPVWTFQFSRDEKQFVIATRANAARVWDARTLKPITPPLLHDDDWVNSAEFSPDGCRVVTASRDHTARVWDARTGEPLLLLRHEGEVQRGLFSPDGEWIATASNDGTARLWSSRTGQPRFPPLHHRGRVLVICFSPDGQKLLTSSDDGSARLWDARTGNPLNEPMEHPDAVSCAEFSPDGQRIVTGANDSGVRLWDVRTGQRMEEVFHHSAGDQNSGITSAKFSADGQWLVSAAMDTTVQVWDAPAISLSIPGWLSDLAEAVAEQRFVEGGGTEPVGWPELVKLKKQLTESAASDTCTLWAKWFFADRSTRMISPNSPVTIPQYVQRRIEENTVESLQEAVRLSPTNSLALARLALQVLNQDPIKNPRQAGEAEWYSRRAAELSPNDPQISNIRAEVVDHSAKLAKASGAGR